MKKLAVVLVIAVLAVYAMPVFADAGSGAQQPQEKSLFQTFADEINGSKMPERFAVKPVAKDAADGIKHVGSGKVEVFQDLASGIEEGSAKAKDVSGR